MNKIKSLIIAVGMVIATCLPLKAQTPIDRWGATQLSLNSASIAASTFVPMSGGSNAVVDCRYQQTVAFVCGQQDSGANTNVTQLWYELGDGSHYSTSSNFVQFTNNGTTACTATATINVAGFGYISLLGMVNVSGSVTVTNQYLSYQIKTRDQ